ncbi:MAG: sulfite exporter TauE/SafE family protein [Deltaproteobacteria bacterium]|nr:sulfite exporter TauE/SafE family protein [Deltaproteobacteria bacterium]MCB9786425.1 sulfite exporter TauE/SafE family protein [Deltaproteobacteria bacterium]
MSEATAAAWAQLTSLGLVWVSFHCAGMCGPLVVGFDVAGVARGSSPGRGAVSVLTYQAGRALTLMSLGALSGVLGAGLGAGFHRAGAFVALAMGAAVLAGTVWRRRPPRTRLERRRVPFWRRMADRVSRAVLPHLSGGRPVDHLALGLLMGLLPCMIPLWVLGLAATTGSPIQGALLMLTLVAMTTPMLLGVTLLPRAVRLSGRLARAMPRAVMGISGLWLAMVGLAGLELVDHVHLPLELAGRQLVVMLW